MDIQFTEDQELLRSSVQRLLRDQYDFDARRKILASEDGFNRKQWEAFAELGLPAAHADQDRVMQVLTNLVGNAHKYTGTGGTIGVDASRQDDMVRIAVRDNGVGIPAEIRDKLFQPFFTTKPTGEGTGLGLSISYDIVTQQHGGGITVDSKVGEYSEFTIRLPRSP